jgi:hypothetical protein
MSVYRKEVAGREKYIHNAKKPSLYLRGEQTRTCELHV